MTSDDPIPSLCERGQRLLMEMQYLQAERVLAEAEALAWNARQWEVLSRLYLPLQETRRQIRQRCGQGTIALCLLADGPDASPDPGDLVWRFPAGQLLVAGWGSLEPARQVRQLAAQQQLYLETFLAAVYPGKNGQRLVVIAPTADTSLPPAGHFSPDGPQSALPPDCRVVNEQALPQTIEHASPLAHSRAMNLWEQLHRPLLAAADAQADLIQRMAGYRRVIQADRACELAHQKLAEAAKEMARQRK